MYCLFLSMILTLVISSPLAFAKPHQDIDPVVDNSKNENSEEIDPNNKAIEEYNLNISEPIKNKFDERKTYYYPFTQAVSPRIGALVNIRDLDDEFGNSFKMLYGFNYLLPRHRSPQLELGADLIKDYNGQFHASKRWTLNERTSFRPFYKLGLTLMAVGKEGLATLTNHKNYLAHASVGFEDYFKSPTSFRIELEIAVGFEHVFIYTTFGYSWGF